MISFDEPDNDYECRERSANLVCCADRENAPTPLRQYCYDYAGHNEDIAQIHNIVGQIQAAFLCVVSFVEFITGQTYSHSNKEKKPCCKCPRRFPVADYPHII